MCRNVLTAARLKPGGVELLGEGGETKFLLSSLTEAIPLSASEASPLFLQLTLILLLVSISQPYSGWLQVGRNAVQRSLSWSKGCAFSRQSFLLHYQSASELH